jgi:ABC-type uncharacterized transport system involved in gliding motility auxiliary subunit
VSRGYRVLFYSLLVLLYLVLVAIWISIPDEKILNLSLSGFCAVLTVAIGYFDRKNLQHFYMSQYFKKFSQNFVTTILILGILGFVNYLAFKNSIHFDVTANKKNSLTAQTVKVLKSIPDELTIKVFARKETFGQISALLDLFRFEKNDLVIEMIDVELRPDLVKQFSVSTAPTLVLNYGKKKELVTQMSEVDILNGLVKVTRKKDPVVYLIKCHGENSLNNEDKDGMSYKARLVQKQGVITRTINLLRVQQIPANAAAVVLWGPSQGLRKKELTLINDYLGSGGKLIAALDPVFGEDVHQELKTLLNQWGVQFNNGMVIDKVQHVSGSKGAVPIVSQFNQKHDVTRGLSHQVLLPLSMGFKHAESSQYKTKFYPLIQSSPFPASWLESSLSELSANQLEFHEGKDIAGPIYMAGIWEQEEGKAAVAMFGSSRFLANNLQNVGGNFLLFLNTLSWAIYEDRLISFNIPSVKEQPVFVSAPQRGIIFYFCVIFAPLILFVMASIFYNRKRVL